MCEVYIHVARTHTHTHTHSYRKCHCLVRDIPLKTKTKKTFVPPEGSPPPLKRPSSTDPYYSESRPFHASPFKSKRFSLVPDRGPKDSKTDALVVQIHWPVSRSECACEGSASNLNP